MTRLQKAIADLAAAVEARDIAEQNAVNRVRHEFAPIMLQRQREFSDASDEAVSWEHL